MLKDPKKGPISLAVEMAASRSIPKPLMNKDRIGKEKRLVLQNAGISRTQKAEDFIEAFANFEAEHSNLIRRSVFGHTTVITLQSKGMRMLALQEGIASSKSPTAGIISNGAHKFWRLKNAILIGSSIYSQNMESWAPIALSFANGNSADHYQVHFEALLSGIVEEKRRMGMEVDEKDFAQVSTSPNDDNSTDSMHARLWTSVLPREKDSSQPL